MSDAMDGEIEGFLRAHGPFEEPPLFSVGEQIGDWKTLAFLGRGGSAEVYRAENVVTGIVGALKVLFRSDGRSRERFKRETRLIAETKSAAFPMFYGAGEHNGHLYIAEELLEQLVLPSGDSDVARFILDVATGVEELHRCGFVHRDLKPANILLRPSTGESVLIDMGLAKESRDAPQTRNETVSVIDGHAVGVGTPGFSAPEQFTGGKISAAMDIHALGMLANTCFRGTPPRAWSAIIRRSTSSIPEQRYATVADFARAIRRRHAVRWWIAMIAAASIAIVATLVVAKIRSADNTGRTYCPQRAERWREDTPPSPSRTEKATSPDVRNEKRLSDAILEAAYDMQYAEMDGHTNQWGESIKIDKKAALDAMRKGIIPSY